ncbi:helix-turn-helix transcriptional regulator [Kribbella sandramycini]|uniref:DNA-binding transcriptional ArsR family regulator n=1 Tax=Kribbella sandramycini TaxID=60450 RepID=A0A7Y4L6P7_9ACTN|nr:DNA-binding transcriptional ArsR family regulator [Kribbella sandramycini]NOL45420.1 helix-turn-helix transcriptional regulator [Kribbella sandramycini]
MITIGLTPDAIGRIRFALSPIWEAVTSVRALSTSTVRSVHGPWLQKVRPIIDGPDLTLLKALIPPVGYIPDFITPAPPRRTTGLESGLAAIAATPHALVAAELGKLHDETPNPVLPGMIARPAKALQQITTALETYFRRTIEPDWRRMRALLQEDLAFRLDELASGGIERLFRNLHPSVRFRGDAIEIDRPYCCHGVPMAGQGVLLVPCVFTWPAALPVTGAPHLPTITYPPRGLGRLWEDRQDTTESPLADLVGRTRAAIVGHLDLPMSTTHLAHQLGVTAPTLSVHLSILRNAGLVDSRRDGRAVLYYRTRLGSQLLAASTGLASTA